MYRLLEEAVGQSLAKNLAWGDLRPSRLRLGKPDDQRLYRESDNAVAPYRDWSISQYDARPILR